MGKQKIIGTCKLCRKSNVQLVESHIIPQSFFEPLKGTGGNRPVLIVDGNTRAEYTQSGVYENFLCHSCEQIFGPWDSHGKAVLMAPYDERNLIEPTVYNLPDADYKKLKLFFLSILWRGSHAQHKMYKHIQLGPHEPILREMILNADPGPPESYSVLMEKFINIHEKDQEGRTFFDPVKGDVEDLNAYILYLAGYKVFVVIDKRKFPAEKAEILLTPQMAPVFLNDYQKSYEAKVWIDLMMKSVRRKLTEKAAKTNK